MIKLSKLEQGDFAVFKSWIKSEVELFQVAGPALQFPITDEQLLHYISDHKRLVYKVILLESDEMIGNGELNFENPLPRLSKILIGNKSYRGMGVGRIIIDKMLEKLFFGFNFQHAELNVFDWNKVAIRCYESVGFVINKDVIHKHSYNNEIWTGINMIISKEDWIVIRNKKLNY